MLKSILQGVLLKRYWQNKQKFGPRAFSTSTHPGQDPKKISHSASQRAQSESRKYI